MTHEQVFIANQTQKHDHIAVAAFTNESLRDLKERFGVVIRDIINWSDNWSGNLKVVVHFTVSHLNLYQRLWFSLEKDMAKMILMV